MSPRIRGIRTNIAWKVCVSSMNSDSAKRKSKVKRRSAMHYGRQKSSPQMQLGRVRFKRRGARNPSCIYISRILTLHDKVTSSTHSIQTAATGYSTKPQPLPTNTSPRPCTSTTSATSLSEQRRTTAALTERRCSACLRLSASSTTWFCSSAPSAESGSSLFILTTRQACLWTPCPRTLGRSTDGTTRHRRVRDKSWRPSTQEIA